MVCTYNLILIKNTCWYLPGDYDRRSCLKSAVYEECIKINGGVSAALTMEVFLCCDLAIIISQKISNFKKISFINTWSADIFVPIMYSFDIYF